MAAGDVKTEYAASAEITITLDALASSATFVAGRESAAIDNTTNKYLDYLISGEITTGTNPTAGEIRIYVVALMEDSTWPDVFGGDDTAETVTDVNQLSAVCKLAKVIPTDTTSDQGNFFSPFSVASLFGGVLPKKFSLFVAHNTVANLESTAGADHNIYYTPVYATVAQ